MTLLKEHKKKLREIRRRLVEVPGLEGYLLLSYNKEFLGIVDNIVAESRLKAYASMVKNSEYTQNKYSTRGLFYIVTKIEKKKPKYFEENLISWETLKSQMESGKIAEPEFGLRILKLYGPWGIERRL